MSYWACARAEWQREQVAAAYLNRAGFTTYLPRLRQSRTARGRKIEVQPPLFPGYLFVQIVNGWWQARWSPGVAAVLMDGEQPAHVPDSIIAEIRSRERDGLIELPRRKLVRGDRIRVVRGAFFEQVGLFDNINGHGRVHVLLSLLGAARRVTLPRDDVEPFV
jgi:transcriptional antiterminator RfaH